MRMPPGIAQMKWRTDDPARMGSGANSIFAVDMTVLINKEKGEVVKIVDLRHLGSKL